MSAQTKAPVKQLVTGTLIAATGVLASVTLNPLPAKAQIGGGGTCTPHPVTYQQYIAGYYDANGNWIPSHYQTMTRMSTECNNPNPPMSPDISGTWYRTDQFNNPTTSIAQNGSNSYLLTNEQGSAAFAYINGNQIIAPGWQVSGQFENNNQQIAWSNGTIWSRTPGNSSNSTFSFPTVPNVPNVPGFNF